MTDTLQSIEVINAAASNRIIDFIVKYIEIARNSSKYNIPQLKQGSTECLLSITALPTVTHVDVEHVRAEAERQLKERFEWDDAQDLNRATECVLLIFSNMFTLFGIVNADH